MTNKTTNFELQDVSSKFLVASDENRVSFQSQLTALQSAVDRLSENSSLESTSEHADTPPDRRRTTRRTPIFFSAPSASKSHVVQRQLRKRLSSASPDSAVSNRPLVSTTPSVIKVLQAGIVYENQLKVSKKIGKVGYWATSISTVRTTVLSEKVIKTDLFPDLDIIFRILDI